MTDWFRIKATDMVDIGNGPVQTIVELLEVREESIEMFLRDTHRQYPTASLTLCRVTETGYDALNVADFI